MSDGHAPAIPAPKDRPERRPRLREALEALPEGWFLEDPAETGGLWRVVAYRRPPLGPADVIEAGGRTRETCLHQVAMLLERREE